MSSPMRIVVCGSRDWTDRETIRAWLARLPKDTEIAHGECGKVHPVTHRILKGADKLAGEIAEELGFAVRAYPAEWERYGGTRQGNPAGPIRNEYMLNDFRPARVLAFTEALIRGDGAASRPTGTTDCVMRAIAKGIVCTIIPSARSGQ